MPQDMGDAPDYEPPVQVPYKQLQPQTLRAVIEEFVTRDGTELSDADRKVEQVKQRLDQGELIIMYDPNEQSVNILPAPPK